VVARIGITYGIRPRLIGPQHRVQALDPVSTGFGSEISPGAVLNSWFNGGASSALDPATPRMPDAWLYSTRVLDGSGHDLTDRVLDATCPGVAGGGGPPAAPGHIQVPAAVAQQSRECVTAIAARYHELVTYQPAGRYWAFQWAETAVCCSAALLLGAFCLWQVRRLRPV
jgi:hypothetical protein